MLLHNDTAAFREIIQAASMKLGIKEKFIEKDYYVSLLLKNLAECNPNIVFKGGTSLSKCHKLIDRFSEDIDLAIPQEIDKMTEGMKRKLKKDVLSVIEKSNCVLINPNETRSRRDFNRYAVKYTSIYGEKIIAPIIFLETFIAIKAFPTVKLPINNFINSVLTR